MLIDGQSFCSTQILLPSILRLKVVLWGIVNVPSDYLYTESDWASEGREIRPHVTVKYGIEDGQRDQVREILSQVSPFKVKLGKMSFFDTDTNNDVLKIEVEGPKLHQLNAKISEGVKTKDTHPEYNPHVTIAYLQKGKLRKFEGDDTFAGIEIPVNFVEYSDTEENITPVALNIPEYERPWDISRLKAEGLEHLASDPIHQWRAETGIELVHREPSQDELDRIWKNWQRLPDDLKALSDNKSIDLGMWDNQFNYALFSYGNRRRKFKD